MQSYSGSVDAAGSFTLANGRSLITAGAFANAGAVIIVDASEIGEKPGTIRVFNDEEIDRQISNKRRTVHEVALVDLFSAAAIRGRMPARRVLVAIQPECTEWGVDLTPAVQKAVPEAVEAILKLAAQWQQQEAAA